MLLLTPLPASGAPVVAAACFPDIGAGCCVATDSGVACYAYTAGGSYDGAAAAVDLQWKQTCLGNEGGRLLHAAPLAADSQEQVYLVITKACEAIEATILAAPSHSGRPNRLASQLLLQTPNVPLADELPSWFPVFSNVAPCQEDSSGGNVLVMLASLQQGTVHLLRAEQMAGGGWSLSSAITRLCNLLTTEPEAVIVVESLALGAASEHLAAAASGCLHCAILYSNYWVRGSAKHVACLVVRVPEAKLSSCCWFVRNVHPSTFLVAAMPGARTLVASSRRFLLVHSGGPQHRHQLAVQLMGRPTCAVALSQQLAVVGDSQGQLLLLDMQHLRAAPVAPQGLLCTAPSCLAFLPMPVSAGVADAKGKAAAAAADLAAPVGALFVGSSSGGSLFLEVPLALFDSANHDSLFGRGPQGGPASASGSGSGDSGAARRLALLGWQAVLGGEAGRLAASLAPVSSCQLIDDPSGCGDKRLLMCCGMAPFGRLALARLAVGLTPLAVGGNHLPDLMRLLGLKASPTATTHRYLLLSSEALPSPSGGSGGWTTVLEATASGLHAAVLLGLQLEAATLLAASLANGHMLQVTPQGVHVFRPSTGDVLSSWQPPGGAAISFAAACGQHVAVACGADVHVLLCSSGTGRLQKERRMQLPQQASALALFQLLGGEGEGGAALPLLAAGLWVTNELLLQPLSAEQPACRLSLGQFQPRSLAVCHCQVGRGGGRGGSHLAVGTSSGEVLWWRLVQQLDGFGGSSGVQLEACWWARVGLAPVTLHAVPLTAQPLGGAGSILAVSDQSLLLSPNRADPSRLAVARVHGGQGLAAVCPLATWELPGSSLAYIHAGQLIIGALDPTQCLRWDELALDGSDRPTSLAYHAASGYAAVTCWDPASHGGSLRLVDVTVMRETGRVPLPAGHGVTGLAVAQLPCSSHSGQHVPPGTSGGYGKAPAAAWHHQQPQSECCSPYLLVGLAPPPGTPPSTNGDSHAAAEAAQLPLPEDADAGQPWWRQKHSQQEVQQEEESSPEQPAGLLAVYELHPKEQEAAAPAGGGSQGSGGSTGGNWCELVLHGTCALPAAAFSFAVVQPEAEPLYADPRTARGEGGSTAAGSAAGTPPLQQPLLAVGCSDGTVRLYRVYVDDARMEGRYALEQGLTAIIDTVPPLRLAGPQAAAGTEPARPDADAVKRGQGGGAVRHPVSGTGVTGQSSRRLWHGHVALQLVAKAPTLFEGIPVALAVRDSTLHARDLLCSVTTFKAQPVVAGQLPSLVPLASDWRGRHVSAMLPLTDELLVVGAQPGGLLLMQHDEVDEHAKQAAVRQQWQQRREEGGVHGEAGAGGGTPPPPSLQDAVPLRVVASNHMAATFAGMGSGQLGVPLYSLQELHGGGGGGGGDSGSGGSGDGGGGSRGNLPSAPAPAATLVCTNGTVISALLLTPSQHNALMSVQHAVEVTDEELARSDYVGGCVDGAMLTSVFQQPARWQELSKQLLEDIVRDGYDTLKTLGVI